jgi:hypothetical protein
MSVRIAILSRIFEPDFSYEMANMGETEDFEKLYDVYRMIIHFNWAMAYASMWYEAPVLFTFAMTSIVLWLYMLAAEADRLNDHNRPINSFLTIVILVELYVVIDLLLK